MKNFKIKNFKVKATDKNVTVSFNKVKNVQFKVSYANNAKFKDAKVVKGNYRKTYRFSKKTGKKSYVKVVAYNKIGNKTYTSKVFTKSVQN